MKLSSKIFSVLLILCIIFTMTPMTVYGYSSSNNNYNSGQPTLSRDSVSVKVNSSTSVGFSYGATANDVEIICSNLNAEAYVSGTTLYIKGMSEGTCYITLDFTDGISHGTTLVLEVTVTDKYGNTDDRNYDDDYLEIEKGDSESIYIDLDAYDSYKATVSYSSTYLGVNKSTFTSSGYLKVTGRKLGSSTLKIKYSSGESETYDVEVISGYGSNRYDDEDELYIDLDDTETYYIDLDDYDSDSARITYDDDYVEVNKTSFSSNGYLRITAIEEGESDIKIKYDSGDTVYLTVYCEYGNSNRYEEEETYYLEDGESVSYYVDLDDYRADRATVSYSSSYVSVNKTSFTSNGTLKITTKREGSSTVKVKFDSGDTVYLYIECEDGGSSNYDEEETYTLDKNESVSHYIDLSDYRASRASITYNSSYVTLNKTSFTSSGSLKITAKKEGDSVVTIKYSSGDVVRLNIICGDDYSYTYTTNITDGKDKTGKNFVLNLNIGTDKTALSNGYISGYTDGSFGPDLNITREEFGVMLSRILTTTETIEAHDYIYDVNSSWSKEGIAKLVAMGVVRNTNSYRPSDKITRYEVAEMLYNALNLTSFNSSCALSDVYNTTDGVIIAKCYNAGIISGYPDGTFKGNNNITRAEAVTMLNRIFYANNSSNKGNPFNDIEPTYWAYSAIVKAGNR